MSSFLAWDWAMARYVSHVCMSASWVPSPTMRPSLSTTIWLASWIVLTRWAMMSVAASDSSDASA